MASVARVSGGLLEKRGNGYMPVSLQGAGCPQGTLEWGQAQESHSTAFNLQGKLEASEGRGGRPRSQVAVGTVSLQG